MLTSPLINTTDKYRIGDRHSFLFEKEDKAVNPFLNVFNINLVGSDCFTRSSFIPSSDENGLIKGTVL